MTHTNDDLVLRDLRVRLARAQAKFGCECDNSRWLEAIIRRDNPTLDIASLSDAEVEHFVTAALEHLNNDYSPTRLEALADSFGIGQFAYVEIFEQLDLIPTIHVVAKRA